MKRELSHSILALIFIGGFVFLGCVNPNSDRYFFWNDPLTIAYAEATEVNTLEAYENFLKKYPNSEYLAEVLWRITLIKDTVEDYEKFKLQYPKFNPQIDWIITEKKDSIESYESFLKLYPNSGYDEEVAWRIAEEKDTYEAYETFLKKYSNSPSTWAKEAKKRLYAYSPNISKTSEGLKESNIGKSYTKKDLFNKNVTSLNNYEKFGGYYALVIGNNNYKMLPKLKTCINDARAIAAILEKNMNL